MACKKVFVFLIISFVFAINNYAQPDSTEKKEPFIDKDKLVFGGGIGASFGTYTFVSLSPIVGYRFTDKLIAGPRIIYNYISIKNVGSTSNYGYGLMGRFFPTEEVFLQGEYQNISVEAVSGRRFNVPALHAGGGYYNRPVAFTVLYDLLYHPTNSPTASPLQLNIGLMF